VAVPVGDALYGLWFFAVSAKRMSKGAMRVNDGVFGAELRRRRMDAGLTLDALSKIIHYSKSQLSKVERGLKRPSSQLSRLCDATLRAEGELLRIWREENATKGGGVMVEGMDPKTRPKAAERFPDDGTVPPGVVPSPFVTLADMNDSTLLGAFRAVFESYRRAGQTVAAATLVPALAAQSSSLAELARRERPAARAGLLILASRFAEYTGWLVQESGDDAGALRWTGHAVELASAGGDEELASYAQVRRGLVALYRGDAAGTVAWASAAQKSSVPPRILGLAAQREAQGHALAGDRTECLRALDRARVHLSRADAEDGLPLLGTTHVTDPAAMAEGWCMYDLGRPAEAAPILSGELARVPETAGRARLRFGVREALAYSAAGEIDHACDLTRKLLDAARSLASATVAADLRELARTLLRHRNHPAVREVSSDLGFFLNPVRPARELPDPSPERH
jgi:DNA-binding transcriptional regulator YiaG